jgi:hypothetical protein
MTLLAQRHSMLRCATALAPLIAVAAPVDRAEAGCDPVSPVSNVTVVTSNTGTISGDDWAIVTGGSVTVNNSGRILGGANGTGIEGDTVTVSNTATGTISGGLDGIRVFALANVANAGTIAGGVFGIQGRTVTVSNAAIGSISGGVDGIRVSALANVANAGTISGGVFGIFGIFDTDTGTINVTSNTGTITGGVSGIVSRNSATVNNSGAISGGAGGAGISADDTATVGRHRHSGR